jgi:hypothetical protein
MRAMKCKILNVLVVLVMSLVSGLSFLTSSCKTTTKATVPYIPPSNIVQYIPPSYYACLEVSPDDLLKAYFHPNLGNLALANQKYTNLPVVFKSIRVNRGMLLDKAKDIFCISSVRCIALLGGAVSALRAGDLIDIIGINCGPWPDYPGWLLFTDCIFLPAGSVQLPAPGAPAFAQLY